MEDKPLLATTTGEYFQPVRLHYQVFDHEGLLRTFRKLRCVDRDRTQPRWVWLYQGEAKSLRFKRSHAELPKHLHPIIIGSLYVRTKDKLLLDVRSCERALLAIPFFDEHLPRNVAKVTEAEVVNKLFGTTDPNVTPDRLFDAQTSTAVDGEAMLEKLADRLAAIEDPLEKLRVGAEPMEAEGKRPLPEIERFPVHYYEDGIHGFALTLRLRQIVARQHWVGNTEYTVFDAIQASVRGST